VEIDYTKQLNRIIDLLSRRDPIPTWVVGIIGVVVGASLQRVIAQIDKVVKQRTMRQNLRAEILRNYRYLKKFHSQLVGDESFGNHVPISLKRYEALKNDFSFAEMKEASAIDDIYEALTQFRDNLTANKNSIMKVLDTLEYYEPVVHFKTKDGH